VTEQIYFSINSQEDFIDELHIVFRPARESFTIMESSPLPAKSCKLVALDAFEQEGIFTVPHLL
jgi:hypothetical protein